MQAQATGAIPVAGTPGGITPVAQAKGNSAWGCPRAELLSVCEKPVFVAIQQKHAFFLLPRLDSNQQPAD